MPQLDLRFAQSRRGFLRASTSLAAASALASPLTAWALPQGKHLRTAILVPEADNAQTLVAEFLAGFRHEIETRTLPIHSETLAFANGIHAASSRLETHLAESHADLLISLVSRNQANDLLPSLDKHYLPCLVCDVGADVVRQKNDSPWLIRHSLGYWQASYGLGQWAAQHLGKRALIAADHPESGHDLVYAFHHAFELSGGRISSTQVNNYSLVGKGFATLFAAIRQERPDFVYALYSGVRAEAFLAAYAQSGLNIPLAGPALLTQALDDANPYDHAHGVISGASWPGGHAAGISPMYHLGQTAAQRIAQAARQNMDFRLALAGERSTLLAEQPISLHLQGPSQTSQLYACSMNSESAAHLRSLLKTGWSNPYLLA